MGNTSLSRIPAGSSGTSLVNAVAHANAVGGGVVIELGKGTYNLTSALNITQDGISIVGNGAGSTFIQIDDAGGMAGGNAVTFNKTLWTACKGLTFTASVARTAGSTIQINGRNAITATPAQRTSAYVIEDVDMEDQFNGVVINDGVRTIVVTASDNVVAASHTWTLANGNFTAGDIGTSFKVSGATQANNNATVTISSVTNSTTIVTGGTQTNETFTTPTNLTVTLTAGAWGGFANRMTMLRFGSGGVYFDINSPGGGQHYVGNIKMYGSNSVLDANRALCGVRYRGGADVELFNITSVYLKNGLLCDPNAVAANVLLATECDWDNNTQASIKIAPSGGGTCIGYDFIGGWGFTNNVSAQPCVEIISAFATNISFVLGKYWASFAAFKLNACNNIGIHGIDASASASIGVWLTGSANHVRMNGILTGLVSSSFPPTGVQIDAGCDRYVLDGSDMQACTTPLTNTPGDSANRRIATTSNNITL